MICYWFSEPSYFFFASDIPALLYYSHIPTGIIALLVGLFVFWKGRNLLQNQLLFGISISFALWTLINLILWTNIHSDFLLFSWSFLRILSGLISIFCIYLVYVFLTGHDIPTKLKYIFLLLLAPVIIFAPTDLNVSGFDISNCDAFRFQGVLFQFYHIAFGILAMLWTAILLVRGYRKADKKFKKQILLMGIGIEAFLFSFFTVIYLAVLLTDLGLFADSRLEMYGMFGMTIFMTMIGILIVRYNTFKVGARAAEALVIALILLIGSQFTYVDTISAQILTSVTLALTGISGAILIRSVRREIKQKEEIEKLAIKLEKANERLKELDKMKSEFVSIASHQLRSPLTAVRGYASMLLEGSYGSLPAKAKEAVERIADSSRFMASSVEDYLNVSRIQAGNMKYEYSDFNLKDIAERVADDTRQVAIKKGLLVLFKFDISKRGIVNADIGKTRQIIDNLVNNALKYTPKGTITVYVHDDPKKKKIYVDIIDTGIGMSPQTLDDMFEKFQRAHNANTVNVTGTGLGLYIARKIAREMGGDVSAVSEGEGKGSTFTLELPLQM